MAKNGKKGKNDEKEKLKEEIGKEKEKEVENPGQEQPEADEKPEEGEAPETGDAGDGSDPLRAQIKELQDKFIRQVAEFDNFRKRTDREKAQMFDTGAIHVIEKLLPVVDNFERGLAAAPDADKGDAFADGMNMIYKQLVKMLEDLGVTTIDALGKEFDPNFHNAVMQVAATEEYASGTVAQEMQKGYMYHDTVVRHSMVAVAE